MPERSRPALLTRRVVAWTIAWVAAAALYLLLIDITDLPELIAGAGAAVLAATALELARERGVVGERIHWRWLLRLYRPILRVPLDIVIVSLMALRAVSDRRGHHGTFRALPFATGGERELASGRRALAEAAGSLAPNTFVIGIDEERKLILAHQLRPVPSRKSIDVLELG
jgi:multisubunit Na+/H+ antiporter MnhE subunit